MRESTRALMRDDDSNRYIHQPLRRALTGVFVTGEFFSATPHVRNQLIV